MAGRASEALLAGDAPSASQHCGVEVPDMVGSPMVNRKVQGQVEIAIIKRTIPPYADLPAAHQPFDRAGIERFSKKLFIVLQQPTAAKIIAESSQGHVGHDQQLRERQPEPLS